MSAPGRTTTRATATGSTPTGARSASPGSNGMDCREPWSAAFISWVMQSAGVPESQFRRASAHWVYLAGMIDEADYPGRWFIPRRIADYSPEPGDLICASARLSHARRHRRLHQRPDARRAPTPTATWWSPSPARPWRSIGGNVRNSVSRTTLELDGQGRLQPVPRRPWFLIMENRL